MGSALLMPHQDAMNAVLGHRVIRRQDCATGIPEDLFDFQSLQAFPDDFRSTFNQCPPRVLPIFLEEIDRNGD
jgi:hypothetical protein